MALKGNLLPSYSCSSSPWMMAIPTSTSSAGIWESDLLSHLLASRIGRYPHYFLDKALLDQIAFPRVDFLRVS